jgi:hypothetical protein
MHGKEGEHSANYRVGDVHVSQLSRENDEALGALWRARVAIDQDLLVRTICLTADGPCIPARSAERNRMTKPLIQGRVATEADYHSGVAVFDVQDGHSAPYSLGHNLPIRAELVKSDGMEWPVGSQVSIVQAEITDGYHVTLGVLNGDEQGVCALEDVKLLE